KDNSYPTIHPTQKPVPVLKRLIEIFTDEGDVVIDPVAGSGSTLRAAIEMNRHAYGFEIKKDFYKKAKEQMLATYQTSLF
ncbi:DNA methyltransferase, partial [Streptococcus suis]